MSFDVSTETKVATGKKVPELATEIQQDQHTLETLRDAVSRDGVSAHVEELTALRRSAPALFAELELPEADPAMELITGNPVKGASDDRTDLLPRGATTAEHTKGGREDRC
jgi:hypothetical protein